MQKSGSNETASEKNAHVAASFHGNPPKDLSMRTPVFSWLLGAVVLAGMTPTAAVAAVFVNGVELKAAELKSQARQLGYVIPDGRYWYDRMTGAWGREGQGTAGFTIAGLALGGPLRADASNGGSGVFINGRQLADSDIAGFAAMGIPVYQGRWWVDASGSGGIEGGSASFNLRLLAQQAAAAGRGNGRDSIYSKYGSGDNKTSTWIGSDVSLSHSNTINGKTYDYYIGD